MRRPALGPLLIVGAAALLLAAALFFGGGSSDEPLVWIGGGAVFLGAAAASAALAGVLPRPAPGRAGVAFLALLSGLVLWSGLSILWSIEPDRSWSYFNRGVAYLAFAVVGLHAGALLRRAPRVVAAGLAVLLAAVLLWALAGKVVPALFPDGGRVARLRQPIGYWNALALLLATALPLALWLAARRRHGHALRAAGAVFAYAAIVALLLTYSRGGVVVAVVAVAAWLAVASPRLESLAALLLATPAAVAVSAWAFSRPGVVDDVQPYSVRVRDGAWFGVVLVLGGALVGSLAFLASRLEARRPLPVARRRLLTRLAAVGLAASVLLAVSVAALRGPSPGEWLREFKNPTTVQVTQDPSRLGTLSSNNRWTWWTEAWQVFREAPLKGTGAGSFELARRQLRENSLVVTEPHNLALQFLSETGLAGFLLATGAAGSALLGAAAVLRRLEGAEQAAAAALAVGIPAYLLHALIDFDWDFVAVSAPLFFVVGVLLSAGRAPVGASRRLVPALGVAVLALSAFYSLAAPWLATRRVGNAYEAIERGDLSGAVAKAEEAHRLNPLAVKPLFVWALAEDVRGNDPEAKRIYVRAVDLQPLNWRTWYELGAFEFKSLEEPDRALRHLDRSYALDPWGPAGPLLDEVRAALASRAG